MNVKTAFLNRDLDEKIYMDLLGFMRTNSLTSVRHENGLGYIRIWATPPRRLGFWDGVPNPYK